MYCERGYEMRTVEDGSYGGCDVGRLMFCQSRAKIGRAWDGLFPRGGQDSGTPFLHLGGDVHRRWWIQRMRHPVRVDSNSAIAPPLPQIPRVLLRWSGKTAVEYSGADLR
ncbi:hypothetical protein Tco_0702356 [Tanacetum coccineum]|uniref:Uncharacterized protein n=1 Tax=Tanacetum coccineum TaxID=301880 RepID=A0ABQ4XWS3_9ASTR